MVKRGRDSDWMFEMEREIVRKRKKERKREDCDGVRLAVCMGV